MTSGDKPATMRDVARVAGVSHQTVSRYLRGNGGLKKPTVERISAAIDELDYRPNLIARSLRTRRTGRVAILLPTAGTFMPSRLVAGALAVARREGYAVEVLSVEGGMDARAERARELAVSGQVEGVLAFAPLPADVRGSHSGTVVMASDDLDDRARTIGGLADGAPIAELMAGLVADGHTRFAHITGPLDYTSALARRDAYLATVAELGVESVLVHQGDWSAESGAAGIAALRGLGASAPAAAAVIAANDIVAAGAIRAAVDAGWSVPGDLSVTGWDNHVIGGLLSPRLTTVDADQEMLGARAAERLIAAVRGETAPSAPAESVHRIVWRDSTGPAPR
ncbi:LacI family DNA-binding transcriptional regulator [Microbacterium sp. C7(2022)]|uniref:LacI family DNA-binding transcriptional regulator n=1 Tax=Microbacterium sp. C7(2022) TaxID=2992759 RepID=UPI00237A4B0D|nr:LacI family DNA-binding transcriptional regulator [Microbacterium sp. C7(2022)]MDE0546656.1 LacI family transcriptional regulator [Microbacterium sp. C7(2022)]